MIETSKIRRIIACIRTIGFYIQHWQYIIRPIISQIKQEINNRLHNKKHVTIIQTQNTARTDWNFTYNDWLTSSVADQDPDLIDTLLTDNSPSLHHPRFPCWSFDCVDRNTDSLTCSAANGRTGVSAGSSVWGSCLSGPWCSTLSLGCTWKRLIFVIVILPSTQDSLSRVLRCTGKVLLYGKPQNLAAPNSDCDIESLP